MYVVPLTTPATGGAELSSMPKHLPDLDSTSAHQVVPLGAAMTLTALNPVDAEAPAHAAAADGQYVNDPSIAAKPAGVAPA